jgi:hypothetical protein
MSTSTTEAVRQNATLHDNLFREVSALDYVPAALQSQGNYITELETTLKQTRDAIKKMETATKKEKKEHQDIRSSTARCVSCVLVANLRQTLTSLSNRKFAYRISGKKEKFEQRIEKEERQVLRYTSFVKGPNYTTVSSLRHWRKKCKRKRRRLL